MSELCQRCGGPTEGQDVSDGAHQQLANCTAYRKSQAPAAPGLTIVASAPRPPATAEDVHRDIERAALAAGLNRSAALAAFLETFDPPLSPAITDALTPLLLEVATDEFSAGANWMLRYVAAAAAPPHQKRRPRKAPTGAGDLFPAPEAQA